jgi:hypothetical protein
LFSSSPPVDHQQQQQQQQQYNPLDNNKKEKDFLPKVMKLNPAFIPSSAHTPPATGKKTTLKKIVVPQSTLPIVLDKRGVNYPYIKQQKIVNKQTLQYMSPHVSEFHTPVTSSFSSFSSSSPPSSSSSSSDSYNDDTQNNYVSTLYKLNPKSVDANPEAAASKPSSIFFKSAPTMSTKYSHYMRRRRKSDSKNPDLDIGADSVTTSMIHSRVIKKNQPSHKTLSLFSQKVNEYIYYIYMYVYMYVCIYVCMYICMYYVCMYYC